MPLIKVKALDRKMARQIPVIPYAGPGYPDSPHQRVTAGVAAGRFIPLGWVAGSVLGTEVTRYWLVCDGTEHFFLVPPTAGPLRDRFRGRLEQLFG